MRRGAAALSGATFSAFAYVSRFTAQKLVFKMSQPCLFPPPRRPPSADTRGSALCGSSTRSPTRQLGCTQNTDRGAASEEERNWLQHQLQDEKRENGGVESTVWYVSVERRLLDATIELIANVTRRRARSGAKQAPRIMSKSPPASARAERLSHHQQRRRDQG